MQRLAGVLPVKKRSETTNCDNPQSRCCSCNPALAEVMAAEEKSIDMGVVRRAMALRVKYRVVAPGRKKKRRIPISVMGVHNMNRGGVYPQPDTVQGLGISVLSTGCNEDEANHEGVCVQEVPAEEQGHDPLLHGHKYETYSQYNARSCGQGALKPCFPCGEGQDILYGTLSHSHLLLVLLSTMHGSQWEMPHALEKLLDKNGCIDYAAVEAFDKGFTNLCNDGLEMEVLSYKIYMEEPQACSLISQALNCGNEVALKTTELTALAVLTGAVGLEYESAVAGEVAFETVRESVRSELDYFVDLPEFVDMFEFVITMGEPRAVHPAADQVRKQVGRFEEAAAPTDSFRRSEQNANGCPSLQDCCADEGLQKAAAPHVVPDAGGALGKS